PVFSDSAARNHGVAACPDDCRTAGTNLWRPSGGKQLTSTNSAVYTQRMPARLRSVEVKDYRSIGSCHVPLEPLTLLVGPNGSGKSNFLDALRFVVHSMHAPLEQVIDARSGLKSILRKQIGRASCRE